MKCSNLKSQLLSVSLCLCGLFSLAAAPAPPPAPVGDGIADDTAALQHLIDTTPSGGTITLPWGRVFRITDNLLSDHALEIATDIPGKTSEIYFDASPSNYKRHLWFGPRTDPPLDQPALAWAEKLATGQRPLLKGIALDPKSRYIFHYGTDPFDPHEPHDWGFFEAAIAPAAACDINGEKHSYRRLLTSIDGTTIRDLRFTSRPGVNVDYALGAGYGRGLRFQNLGGDTTSFIVLQWCDGALVDGLSGKVRVQFNEKNERISTSDGRGITLSGTRNVIVNRLAVEGSDYAALIVLENRATGSIFDNLIASQRQEPKPARWQQPIMMHLGASDQTRVLRATIDNRQVQGLYLYDFGGQAGQKTPWWGRVEYTGRILWPGRCDAEQLVPIKP